LRNLQRFITFAFDLQYLFDHFFRTIFGLLGGKISASSPAVGGDALSMFALFSISNLSKFYEGIAVGLVAGLFLSQTLVISSERSANYV
jgi:hypothetical protein